jgi:magnesium chelatase accessory protein
MTDKPVWRWDGRDWPNAAASHITRAGGIDWHVQRMGGQGPAVLLLHGTGAATHSWRDVMPLLAPHATVLAVDLPGHGFTGTPPAARMGLPGMSALVAALLEAEGVRPDIVIGHSAGAAIAIRMALDRRVAPRRIVSLNGALLPLGGVAGQIFSPLARALVGLPFVPWLVAWRAADRATVEKLLRETGSRLDSRGLDLYARLFRRAGHVAGTLAMMAAWDLPAFARDLPKLAVPLTLVSALGDRTISPDTARKVQTIIPAATLVDWPLLGHLAHEEDPALLASLLAELMVPA